MNQKSGNLPNEYTIQGLSLFSYWERPQIHFPPSPIRPIRSISTGQLYEGGMRSQIVYGKGNVVEPVIPGKLKSILTLVSCILLFFSDRVSAGYIYSFSRTPGTGSSLTTQRLRLCLYIHVSAAGSSPTCVRNSAWPI